MPVRAGLAIFVFFLPACASAGGDQDVDAAPPDGRVIDAAPQPDAKMVVPCTEGDMQVQDGETGHCYMYFDTNTSWAAARAICEGIDSDVFLASITTEAENAVIETLVPGTEVWIGGNDLVNEMEFVWISGEPFVFTNWRSGEPNGNNEDCITYQDQLGGVWDDRPCGDNQRVVCERD